jgi:hypothetical protein
MPNYGSAKLYGKNTPQSVINKDLVAKLFVTRPENFFCSWSAWGASFELGGASSDKEKDILINKL